MVTTQELGKMEQRLYNHGSGHTQTIADICFAKADGDFIFDSDGKRYVDLNGTLNLPLGHNSDNAKKAINEGLPLNSVSYATVARLALCKQLELLFPDYTAFQFYSAGTEANEGAIRYAIAITGKDGFASFRKSYHGRTRATVSLGNMNDYNGNRLPGYFRVCYPTTPKEVDLALSDLDERIRMDYGRTCAGVFVEPVQGKTVVVPPADFLQRLKTEICNQYGVLLIADEYLTSMRTGTFSRCLTQGCQPDIMTIGKCLGNGIPFAVLMCHKKYSDRVWSVKGSTTFGGNPFACKTVLLNLEQIQKEKLLDRISLLERIFLEETSYLRRNPLVTDLRCMGALLGIEITDKATCRLICRMCLEAGILVSCIGQVIRITPSFSVDEALFRESIITITAILRERSNG